jgi:hypothetical protein
MANSRQISCVPGRARAAIAIVCLLSACHASAGHLKCFHVFDATAYVGKPDLARSGIEPTNVFEPDRWWPKGERDDDLPEPGAVQTWMRTIRSKHGLLVLDLERWWLRGSETAVQEGMRRYITVFDWIRAAGYSDMMGYYGVIPTYNPGGALQPEGSRENAAWRKENDRVQPLADRVDILFPSLYTSSEDVESWAKLATAQLREAKRLAHGKAVFPFLWPQYEQSSGALGLKYLPRAQWYRELQVVGANADGVVIWGGIARSAHEGAPKWDDSAPWWQATLAYLATRESCPGTR